MNLTISLFYLQSTEPWSSFFFEVANLINFAFYSARVEVGDVYREKMFSDFFSSRKSPQLPQKEKKNA